jgi:hypothetical protein
MKAIWLEEEGDNEETGENRYFDIDAVGTNNTIVGEPAELNTYLSDKWYKWFWVASRMLKNLEEKNKEVE